LTAEENSEIRRILREYSQILSEYVDILKTVCLELVEFDIFHAKARFGISYHAVIPGLNNSKNIKIINGRHPMIKNAVPLNIEFNRELSILVITGPNAGGKTVVIKTVALFQMMVQAGIPVPASADSTFCICNNIYLDIGDEQSIEDSLSTFSGHLKRLKEITDKVGSDDLVVLDELGSGTSPVEGEALALSILEYLLEKNCIAVVTTHYQRIKQFAGVTPKIKTAAMEYDEENFLPLYRLRVGARGSSHAFDIAKRMGLHDNLISRALELVDNDYINMEENIRRIEQEQLRLKEEREELEKEREECRKESERLEKEIAGYKENNREINKILRDKKRDFLASARKEFESLVKNIKESSASKDSIKEGKKFFDSFENVNLLGDDIKYLSAENNEKEEIAVSNEKLKQGDCVIDLKTNIKGTVVHVKSREIQVQFGAIKLVCKPENLKKVNPDKNKSVYTGNVFINECKKREIDIRGMRAEDVTNQLERYIDNALTANISELKILHGTGAGVLRKMVHDFLKNCPYVKKFEFEKCGDYQTNFGVTIVTL
jgi:DNA mismatch repair protein MutS2